MKLLRLLSIPVITILLAGIPVFWAFPGELRFWRASGIVLGWAGCGLLLASLLLMLREARLASWLGGLERMYRWHHGVGTVAYISLLAHPLALAINAWIESPVRAWQTLSPLNEGWPVWLGWIALLLLMSGLATSFVARLPYRLWRWLHGLLGVGVVVGLAHVFQLLGSSLPVLMAAFLVLSLLAWRLIRVDWGKAARPYLVRSVQHIAEAMVEISLSPLSTPIPAKAGQFVLVAFQRGANYRGCGEYHPFTISSVGADLQISIGVKALGDCTGRIQAMEAGVAARVQGPFGVFLADRPEVPQLWIAGGIGITPFLAVLRAAPLSQPVRLLYLYRSDADAAFLTELQTLAAGSAQLSLLTHATASGRADLATMLSGAGDLTGHECYLCGPPGLVAAAVRFLQQQGLKSGHIHYESFDFR